MDTVRKTFPDAGEGNLGVGSTIFAVKPGDGSAVSRRRPPEGAWRMGEYCQRVCDKALSLQSDQLGYAPVHH